MTTKAKATMIVHCGGQLVDRAFLRSMPDPVKETELHNPNRFDFIVDEFEAICNFFGRYWLEESLQIATAKENKRLFMTVQIDPEKGKGEDLIEGEVGTALGLRSSVDRSISNRASGGGWVTVCDNLVLSGEEIILSKKSTKNLDLSAALYSALKGFFAKDLPIKGLIENARCLKLSNSDAKARLWDMRSDNIVPKKYLDPAAAFYFDGEYEGQQAPECQQYKGTLWGLHNAFTRTLKAEPLVKRYPATQKLGRLLTMV